MGDPVRNSTAGNWPSFHNGGNTSVRAAGLPLTWSPTDGIDWIAELPGYGQSAPIVWDGLVLLTSIEGEQKETCVATAIDAVTGEVRWTKRFPATTKRANTSTASRAAPTPLADPSGLYLLFESGDLISLTHDGDERWRTSFFDEGDRAFQNGHGYGASPTQTDDAVIVLVDHKGPSYLTAISKASGESVWTTERTSRSSWTSPHVAQVGDTLQVIVSSGGSVDGYDAATGALLWTHEGITGNTIPSVTLTGDRVFVGASESRRGGQAKDAAASNCCLQIRPDSADGYSVLWKAEKAVCHYISPLVHDGCAYYVNNLGVLRCVDAETGVQIYEVRMGEQCWAQPIATGDRLYFFGKNGITKVVRAGRTYELLADNRLWAADAAPEPDAGAAEKPESNTRPGKSGEDYFDPVLYAAVAVDCAVFVRTGTQLFRISGESAGDQGPAVQTTN